MFQTTEANYLPISQSIQTSLTKIIRTQDSPEHLIRATSAFFNTIANRNLTSERYQTVEKKPTANKAESWARATGNVEYTLEKGYFQSIWHDWSTCTWRESQKLRFVRDGRAFSGNEGQCWFSSWIYRLGSTSDDRIGNFEGYISGRI